MLDSIILTILLWAAAAFIVAIGIGVLYVLLLYIADVTQTKQTIRRNFPVIGRFRYSFEHMGEFFRQYFFSMDREEMPFNRAERSWVYRAAKNVDSTIAFGSTRSLANAGEVMFLSCPFPTLTEDAALPKTITIGDGYAKSPYKTNVAITLLLFGVGVFAIVLERFVRIPYTLLLVALGFILSLFTVEFDIETGVRASNFQDLMLFILLPVLIFEAAFVLDSKLLFKYLPNVLTLATIGLLISTTVVAVFLYYGINHSGFPFIAALLTGVVISATDPVAVVSQLKQLKAPADLNVLIEGESLFNDATAIVLFGIILSIALGQSEPNITSAIITFSKVFFGGIIIGSLLGYIAALIVKFITVSVPHIVVITLLLAYGTFYLAEHLLHVSGIVAVMFAALIFKKSVHSLLAHVYTGLHTVWESLGFIANIFVFVLLGLVVSLNMFTEMWLAILLAICGAFIARIAAVYISTWLNHFTGGQPINPKYPPIMIWGGLRGAVTIALVLSLPTELPYWWTIQSIGFGIVIFTLLVQATTTPILVRKLKI